MDTVISLTNTALSSQPRTPDRARAMAEDFEASFLEIMINTMMEGLGDDPVTGGGEAAETFRSMMNEQYAKAISTSGGIGVADQIYRELIKFQEQEQ